MSLTIIWLFVVTVVFNSWSGRVERAQFVAGGLSAEECEEVRDNVMHFGRAAPALAGLTVKRLKATECVPMAVEVADDL